MGRGSAEHSLWLNWPRGSSGFLEEGEKAGPHLVVVQGPILPVSAHHPIAEVGGRWLRVFQAQRSFPCPFGSSPLRLCHPSGGLDWPSQFLLASGYLDLEPQPRGRWSSKGWLPPPGAQGLLFWETLTPWLLKSFFHGDRYSPRVEAMRGQAMAPRAAGGEWGLCQPSYPVQNCFPSQAWRTLPAKVPPVGL